MLCPTSFGGRIRDVDEVSPSSHIEREHETKQIKPPLYNTMKHGQAPPSRAFEDNHHTDHSIIIDLRNPLGPRWSNDETQIIPNIVLQHCFRKRLLHGEANGCCIILFHAVGYARGAYTYILQHTILKVLFSPYDNTCIRMNMTYLSFTRIDYRKVPTSLCTCEYQNPIT